MRLATLLAPIVALALVLGPAGAPALGHTSVAATLPADGATLTVAPERLQVTFFSPPARLERARVRLGGRDVGGRGRFRSDDARVLVLPIERRAAGRYVGEWTVLAGDGHAISGSTAFTVSGESPAVFRRLTRLGQTLRRVGEELRELSGERQR